MSANRKHRRKLLKQAPKLTNENAAAVIAAVNNLATAKYKAAKDTAPALVETVLERVKRDYTPIVQAQMIYLSADILHRKFGFGAKRLTDYIRELSTLIGVVCDTGIDCDGIKETLEKECKGLDFIEAFKAG